MKRGIARWAYRLQPVEGLCTHSHVRILLVLVRPRKRNTEIPQDTNDWRWGFNFGSPRWFLDKVTAGSLLDLVPTNSEGTALAGVWVLSHE